MKFGYGPITCQKHPEDSRSEAEIFQDGLNLAVEAERLGFDTFWVCEHHFVRGGWVPALLPFCAAVAARTESIRIGAGTIQTPFWNPLLLAEEAAMVDLLSNGRLILGLGQGWRPEQFAALGLDMADRARSLVETVDVLRAAWGPGLVEPPLVPVPVVVEPKPAQVGGPPLWFGSEAETAVRRAGELGDGWQATMVNAADFAQGVGWAKEGLSRSGRSIEDFEIGLHHATFVWEESDAWETVRPFHQWFVWTADQIDFQWAGEPTDASTPFEDLEADYARELISVGTVEEVAQQVAAFQSAVDVPIEYSARLYFPGLDPDIQRRSMQLFAERVIPRVREILAS